MSRRSSKSAVPTVAVLAAAALSPFAGCGEDYFDEPFGVLEIGSLYDGGSLFDPTGGLPERIEPQGGFEAGERAEYYDFGVVPTLISPETGAPTVARVASMYFFFTKAGFPLFSAPMRETRDGTDHIRGGKGVLNPNPKNFCLKDDGTPIAGVDPIACEGLNRELQRRPYGTRYRELLIDPLRKVADYQRPIIDVSPENRSGRNALYTGLWEIIEITVPDGYEPDAIKHKLTLDAAIGSGGFKQRATGRVINCPVVDELTAVPTGVTDRAVPHPLIELWYRRKQTFCFLANGWLTLGTAPDAQNQVARYPALSDAVRIDTFDVSRVTAGEGKAAAPVLLVPVTPAYLPDIFTFDNLTGFRQTRIGEQILTSGRPRANAGDPPGYTPIHWMWDVIVQGEFADDSFQRVSELDDGQITPRNPIQSRNLPMRGVAIPCSYPKVAQTIDGVDVELCGVKKMGPGGMKTIVDPTGDPVCQKLGLECNKDTCFCDAPLVGYGQRCGFGLARCNEEKDEVSDKGYTCFPATVGMCHLRCDPRDKNILEKQNEGREPKDFVDSRCKGLPGYNCFGYQRAGICLKFCDENITDRDLTRQCSAVLEVKNPDMPALITSVDVGAGQICQNYGVQICTWPDDYSP